MYFDVMGYSQKAAFDMGLTFDDLALLRWVDTYAHAGTMKQVKIDGKEFYWVYYAAVLEQMPLIQCKKAALALRFRKLVNAGVLTHNTFKKGGTYSVYGFGDNFYKLVPAKKKTCDQLATDSRP